MNFTNRADCTADSATLKKLSLAAMMSLVLATTGWSYGGAASDSSTIQPAGPRTTGVNGANNTNFFNMEGSANNANASFGVVEFTASSFNIGAGVTAISNLTLTLTESTSAFTAPGGLNFYLSQDTSTNIKTGVSTLKYDATNPPEGIGSQLTPLTLLGTGSFTTTGNATNNKVDTYFLTLPSTVQSYFISQVNAGSILRFVVTANTSTTAATFAGATNSGTSFRPMLSFDATLNQPSLIWKGGSGSWNPPNSAGDTNWSGGPWQTGNQAIFNVAGGGNVALTGPNSAIGMTFDADGYTVSGSPANPLTLTGGIVQVTNAGQTATIGATLAGSVGITKNGSGTLALTGQNSFTGLTTINAGALVIGSDGNLGNSANGVTLGGGTLRTSAAVTLGSGRTLGGAGTLDMAGGNLTVSGPVAASALTIANGTATFSNSSVGLISASVNAGSNLTVTGNFVSNSGASAPHTTFTGDGAVQLLGNNAGFSSGFQMSRGTGTVGPTVTIADNNGLGGGSLFLNAGTLQSASNRVISVAISLGGSASIGGTSGAQGGTFEFNNGFALFGASKKVLTVNTTTTISSGIQGDTGTNPNNSLNKAGAGRLIINAFNQNNGGTTITNGALEVTTNGALGGGDITLAPIAGVHVTLQLDYNDALSSNPLSNIILGGNSELNLNFAGAPQQIGALVINGVSASLGLHNAGTDMGFITGTGSVNVTSMVAAPEPSTWMWLGAGLAVLAGARLRRRARA